MATWVLRGREHQTLAAIELHAESDAAIAISIGGAPKVYAHSDPNEDGALLQVRERRRLLAVADGHGGCEAAETALATVEAWERDLPDPISEDAEWETLVLRCFAAANASIRAGVARGDRRRSRTTLSLALVDPAQDAIRWASIGDSHVFHAASGVLDLSSASAHDHPVAHDTYFLGFEDETEASLAAKVRIGNERLSGSEALVLATDGLSERGIGVDEPEEAVEHAVQAAALEPEAARAEMLARKVVEAALASHQKRRSGDNIAAAVAWLAGLRVR